jgi:hypothetical protein
MANSDDLTPPTPASLLASAAVELKKAQRDLAKAQARAQEAEMRHRILQDIVSSLRLGTEELSLRQRVLDVVGYSWMTANEILEAMKERGYEPNPKNPTAAILVTAERLDELEGSTTGPKSYRKLQTELEEEVASQ